MTVLWGIIVIRRVDQRRPELNTATESSSTHTPLSPCWRHSGLVEELRDHIGWFIAWLSTITAGQELKGSSHTLV